MRSREEILAAYVRLFFPEIENSASFAVFCLKERLKDVGKAIAEEFANKCEGSNDYEKDDHK